MYNMQEKNYISNKLLQKTFLIHAIINGLEYQIYLHDDLNLLVFFIIGIHSINVVVCLSRQAVM